MMAKSLGISKNNSALLRLVEERLLAKKIEQDKKHEQETQVPYLPTDCVSNILVRLPPDSLQRSRFVCKSWYDITKNPKFIGAHLQRCESVLIYLSHIEKKRPHPFSMAASIPQEKPNTVSVEHNLLQPNPIPIPIPIFSHPAISYTSSTVKFLEFNNDGKSEIGEYGLSCSGYFRATCNGLVLLDNILKKGGLLVMNPVTRKVIALPVATLSPPRDESYGFAMIDATGEYKLVHLFRDVLGYVSCEIFSLWTKSWREVNGPPNGLFSWFGYGPVSAIGALHWIPQVRRSHYIVSMEVDKEKFHQITLPKSCKTHDRLVEIGGSLGFVVHEDVGHIDIWILEGFYGDVWTKIHTIRVGSKRDMVPLFTLRLKGDIIFKRNKDGSFYAYNFQQQQMRKVKMVEGFVSSSSVTILPHVNSLVSWVQESQDTFD